MLDFSKKIIKVYDIKLETKPSKYRTIVNFNFLNHMDKRFNKVIIWGHFLGSDTFSYIHSAFHKAFKHLGYETLWLDNNSDISGIDFTNSLFLTNGLVDSGMPKVKGCYYILHNSNRTQEIIEHGGKCLIFQVYTHDAPPRGESINKYTIIENSSPVKCLYSAWATDLLPHEIDPNSAMNVLDNKVVYWVGTHQENLESFFRECRTNEIGVKVIDPWGGPITFEENRNYINSSFISPSIQSNWQVSVGYIPCRIFKNISYGHFGYTNSAMVNSIFDNELVYSPDVVDLFYKSIEFKNSPEHIEKLKYLMNEVKNKHTYINRIEEILRFLPE